MNVKTLQVSIILCLVFTACSSATAPAATPTRVPTATATATDVPTATATLAPPFVTTTAAVDCYSGPSSEYLVVETLEGNQQVEVIGHTRNLRFWVIKAGNGANCWLDRRSTVYPESDLPRLAALETVSEPKLLPPLAPSEVKVSMQCQKLYNERFYRRFPYYQYTVSLTWEDNAKNESGYYIYKDGNVIKQLEPNATSIVVESGDSKTIVHFSGVYAVASWNSVGTSEKIEDTANFSCT